MSDLSVNSILDASGGATTTINGYTPTVSNMAGRNKIINGGMGIDQRNAGASVTPADGAYLVDRWQAGLSQASKFSVQQNAGAATLPAGFANYLGVTSSSAYSSTAGDIFAVTQKIEGYNFSDLGWGTPAAKSVTLSFWVRSSLTGTFGGSFTNNANNRSYPFTYTVNVVNTWEQKTITVVGDTTGTWLSTTGVGVRIWFNLGTGSTYSGTAGAWAGSTFFSATGATNVLGTSGATFYITGVQLEAGSVATPFERRQYGQELALCQRYYWQSGGAGSESIGIAAYCLGGNGVWAQFCFPTTMRATPTVTVNGTWVVSSCGQPTIRGASTTNFLLQTIASSNTMIATYPNSVDDFLSASSEL